MRGFVITLAVTGIIALLVALSSALYNSHLSMERALAEPQPLMYAAFLFDDVAGDINEIAGPGLSVNQSNASVSITVRDTVPNTDFSSELGDYETFLEGTIANQTNSVIDANLSNLTSGRCAMTINGIYEYENDPLASTMTFTSQGGTGASQYTINITVEEERTNYTSFPFGSGDINVTVMYTDENGTVNENGVLSSSSTNSMMVEYAGGGSLDVKLGTVSGNDGSLEVGSDSIIADVVWTAELPALPIGIRTGYEYDGTLQYTQGKISLSRRIGR